MVSSEKFDINDFLNSFLSHNYEKDNLLFDNINIFYQMSQFVGKKTSVEIPKDADDWNKMTKSTFFQNINLINSFFKKIGIPFEVDRIVSDGTIDIITTDYDTIMHGVNNYHGEHKAIKIYNNGYIVDSIVWVHEISHYRNQPEKGRGQVNDLLTESLAHATSLIYTDYLEKLGFTYEANFGRYNILNAFNATSYEAYIFSKIFRLFDSLGDTSKEAYKYLYGSDEDYDKVKEEFIKIVTDDTGRIFNALWYTLSGVLSIYMYEEYRKDEKFITKIEELNNSILKGNTLLKCLNIIGITGYNNESLNKINNAYTNFKKSLEDPTTKVLKK